MFTVILYVLYIIGFKKSAVDLAVKWYSTQPVDSKKSQASGQFIDWQKKYPLCEYCTWPLYPGDKHPYCEKSLQDMVYQHEFFDAEKAKIMKEQQRLEDEVLDGYNEEYGDWSEQYDDDDEDPLAGDVEPTGGYYEPSPGPFEAHRLEVMRQHGDYTG